MSEKDFELAKVYDMRLAEDEIVLLGRVRLPEDDSLTVTVIADDSLLLMDQLLVISIDSDGYVPVTVPEIVPLGLADEALV